MSRRIGYARVSLSTQNLDAQLDALSSECDEIFAEKGCRLSYNRPQLEKAIARLGEGDTLVVWKLDRLGGGLTLFVKFLEQIRERGANLYSIVERLDSTTAHGRNFMEMNAVYAEMECEWRRERTRAGLKAARARGHIGGRRRVLDDRAISLARQMKKSKMFVTDICESLGISRSTYYRYCDKGSKAVN